MSPFVVLTLFGFIQVGLLSASYTKIDDDSCVNDDVEAMSLFGFKCRELIGQFPELECIGIEAVCPEQCDIERCYVYTPCEGDECNQSINQPGGAAPFGAPVEERVELDSTCVCDDKVCRGMGCQ